MATFKDFRNNIKPNWCPGCGDFSVQAAIQKACAANGLEPDELAVITGIGCSGRLSGYIKSYGFHSTHGRSLPVAQGVKMANDDLTVIASGGDGDGFAIGMGHTVHALKRNIDITYIVMDNQVYGLTKGQTSPSSGKGFVTKTTPDGSKENPIQPIRTALASGATFVAQSVSSDIKQLTAIIQQAMDHKGFSFINVFSPCVTYNKVNTYDWFKENLIAVEDIEDFDHTDAKNAMQNVMEYDGLLKGIIYHDQEAKSYQENIDGYLDQPLIKKKMTLENETFDELMAEFR
ncbi:2-oxoacid:ferredoxin oxidoreductase subunit beta [Salinicoccus sp. ID82-1]|uniref:2-oxoacid:ferredoxin oxidoreductase subunit beta n=1 Tax=Salinicoccus cyprini TaxID=2493691 RepID=A0A558AY86_9STAP|nr:MULTISPECIES: 2-oxoacid:ferredoxin oxidoreductase subunit beta [Salinicoccus]MCG1008754.1 2-oxoacid:ferredoxin oxidoreductase subunit beta [Salinicoccus sp. ID82-1]TVT29229.1 2-oxoacid:ferredoxin oxidoreductase subunit beta [Salinicoccus cyprini]